MFRSSTWFKALFSPTRPLRKAAHIRLESLEARDVPATFTVTNLATSGTGSLAQAVADANGNGNPGVTDQIRILVAGQLNLPTTLVITEAVNIARTSPGAFVVDGGDSVQLFDVEAETTMRGLTLQNGYTSLSGGAIDASAPLTLINCNLISNHAEIYGGAVFSDSRVVIQGGSLTDNTATGSGGAVSVSAALNGPNTALNDASANLVVSNAAVRRNTSYEGVGGGLNIFGGRMVVRGSTIVNNSAISGGGLAAQTSGGFSPDAVSAQQVGGGTISVFDSVVRRNQAANHGGGIFNAEGTVRVVASHIDNNDANSDEGFSGDGGGIWAVGTVLVEDGSTVNGNFAHNNGGGIYAIFGNVVVAGGSEVAENTAYSEYGGGIYAESGYVYVTSATVRDNYAWEDGGGIYVSGGSVYLTAATVSGNNAGSDGFESNSTGDGGGVYVGGSEYNPEQVGANTLQAGIYAINSTISGNGAANVGGGLYTGTGMTLLNTTVVLNFTRNAGSSGGGIATGIAFNPIYLESTIVAGNTSDGSPDDIDGNASTFGSQFNLIGDADTAGGLTDNTAGNIVGVGGSGTRPIETIIDTALKDNGGLTHTHRLAFHSAAIDTGIKPEWLEFDQRGADRFQGAGVDIGATEGTTLWCNAVAYDQFINVFDSIGSLVAVLHTGLPSVRIAIGDVTGDGQADIVAGSGPGGGAVQVYDGVDLGVTSGTPNGSPVQTFFPYGDKYRSGMTVAVGDFDGSGGGEIRTLNGFGPADEIIVGPGSSNLPVRVIDYATGNTIAWFNAFAGTAFASSRNGVRVAAGDVDGDGIDEVVVGTASPQTPFVQVWDYTPGKQTQNRGVVVAVNTTVTHQFTPAGVGKKGVYVAVGGDLNDDGKEDIVIGSGNEKAVFRVYAAVQSTTPGILGTAVPISNATPAFTNKNSTQEVRVAVRDVDCDGDLEILTAAGPVGNQEVRGFDAATLTLTATLNAADLFVPGTYTGGLFV